MYACLIQPIYIWVVACCDLHVDVDVGNCMLLLIALRKPYVLHILPPTCRIRNALIFSATTNQLLYTELFRNLKYNHASSSIAKLFLGGLIHFSLSIRGRVVKATDLKSVGVPPRRFKSCRMRRCPNKHHFLQHIIFFRCLCYMQVISLDITSRPHTRMSKSRLPPRTPSEPSQFQEI